MMAATMEEYLTGIEQDGFEISVSDDGKYVGVTWHDEPQRFHGVKVHNLIAAPAAFVLSPVEYGRCAEIPADPSEWPDVVSRLVDYYYANR
jgi:hypothetical protein